MDSKLVEWTFFLIAITVLIAAVCVTIHLAVSVPCKADLKAEIEASEARIIQAIQIEIRDIQAEHLTEWHSPKEE